ncbi:DUF4212 domain-containing protein [Caenispirillum bisanense]|uniref:Putative solute:sodium symporter small subunit n=1 Tax=Caenispirillum bisanense TaxID=414052 RepID=A0A286G3I4_9PROT|nr:DUF4212 domain-containing protein [Caenispirillum bisanense]SOD90127.1 putative solute:sodium symporter small subunit [Caenispirillum bisanense]
MSEMNKSQAEAYWKANLRIVGGSLVVWFLVSYGAGILFADALNSIPVGGTGLGFWFAQQGSIIIFLILIAFYAWRMNKLDREFDVDEQ